MKIEANKIYEVKKYDKFGVVANYGTLLGSDVKPLIKGYKYEKFEWEETGMWFSKSGKYGIEVKEVA